MTTSSRPTRDRRGRIMEIVEEQGYCTTAELSREFDVSDMTIRRDVQKLVADGRLRSVHGGVTALPQTALAGTDFRSRVERMRSTKDAIAEFAARDLPDVGAVALDAGTTTLALALAIPPDARLHVVTPSLAVANTLLAHEYVEIVCLGGSLHHQTQSFAGPATLAAIAELRLRRLYLAASGVNADGVYCGNHFDAMTKRALVDVADEVVLLADSSKFSISAMVRACTLDDVDRIVTDDGIPDPDHEALLAHGVEVSIVSRAEAQGDKEEA
ncbi:MULTISPECIES: DeoR/GlpR family DNA-binding transcription regulator [unclassified Amycolatopsis]|uniref:DeoR/GlpR family DNA-binding transcription regulator n=1 Tax=unclassified Amycolatopsis TaxID=2618356 RepID=UPI001C6973A2|nr:DeoR/GlpR family DNA-binding transcription regulator [Amycolatopsis sp. DSM 110486]QYN18101.1 DeoR/GlpR family DNA-binding transcription regulator [Amycolatopsis sp. DSM 110486]